MEALAVVVGVPAIGAIAVALLRSPERSGRIMTAAFGMAVLVAGVLLGLTAAAPDGVIGGEILGLDRPLAILLVVVLGTAAIVAGFASRSLDHDGRAVGFFAAMGVLVTGSTLVMIAAAPAVLAAGWVVSGWALVSLVGFDRGGRGVARARRRIIRSLVAGDLALVLALALAAASSDRILSDGASAVPQLRDAAIAGVPTVDLVAVLIVVAGLSRSAIMPFHRWLVGTLVAPTPVSAIVHAGFVSGAGILLVRFSEPFSASAPAVVVAFALASVTVVLATGTSAARPDVKGSLAWSTVAQMAFMVVQCAVGAFSSAIVHIAGHGMYKASRFLGAGDTVSATVRARRRPVGGAPVHPWVRRIALTVVPAAALGLGVWWFPPLANDVGRAMIIVFAWATLASALAGWIDRRPLGPISTVATGAVGAVSAAATYLGGLRAVERFVEPTLHSTATAIGPLPFFVSVAGAGAVLVSRRLPGTPGERARALTDRWRTRWSRPPVRPAVPRREVPPMPPVSVEEAERSRIRSDVALAGALVAPMWPVSSFVAVNPLGGLESMGFERAAATARRWLHARTHLPLSEYRADHDRGLTRLADLEYVVHHSFAELCAGPPFEIEGRLVSPAEIVVADLLHGPDVTEIQTHRTALERSGDESVGELIDEILGGWVAGYMARSGPGGRFLPMCLRRTAEDPHLGAVISDVARSWLSELDDDPAGVIGAAFAVAGVDPDDRVDEMRGHFARLVGWSGLAKWRNEWALPGDPRPPIAPIEILAARAALEASVLHSTPPSARGPFGAAGDEDSSLDARVGAVAAALAPRERECDLDAIRAVLSAVPAEARSSMWLQAQERCSDERLLALLDRVDPGKRITRPEAQAVFCIDVRSEGLRRHLEQLGDVETLGFAGFFGVPLSIRRVGWDHVEPRSPVLVAPSMRASEHPEPSAIDTVAAFLKGERRRAALLASHDWAKKTPGGAFVLAESFGWLSGPRAALRTLLAPRAARPEPRPTRMVIDDSVLVDQRVFAAESVLRTMGLVDRFAPLVLLCGHTSRTVNNAHASALDCGACGGAPGDDSAMAVATLLNAPDVRQGLVERGIEIPDDVWFVAGLHDTASDYVTILDAAAVPASHVGRVGRLQGLLDEAATAQATARSHHLPGPVARVRDRGADWAQVRPEWGLARAAAFVIGPRSLTTGIDLDGRVFLHGYEAELDPTGLVLETIMTAPLVVAHWISSQYYFSTVDPDVFGAGDKLMHNPIGSVGVVSGDGGDLRVGLPLQSTHIAGHRHHQPVRLLAVIQADLERIEQIIARHRILQTLVAGSWLRIAGRSHPDEPWSIRTPGGTWISSPRPFETATTLAHDTPIEHAEMR